MYYLLLSIFLVISVLLMVVILLQQSKGGGLSGAFGGMGGGEAMFGARGVTTFLHKATIYLGAAFMVISLILALILMNSGSGSNLATEAGRRGGDVLTAPVVEDLSVPAEATGDVGEQPVPPAPADEPSEGGSGESGGGN